MLEPDLRRLVASVADKSRFRWLLVFWLGYLGRLWGSLGHERVLGRVAELLRGLAARLGPRFELGLIDLLDLELGAVDFLCLKVALLFVCLVSVDDIAVLGCQKLQELLDSIFAEVQVSKRLVNDVVDRTLILALGIPPVQPSSQALRHKFGGRGGHESESEMIVDFHLFIHLLWCTLL